MFYFLEDRRVYSLANLWISCFCCSTISWVYFSFFWVCLSSIKISIFFIFLLEFFRVRKYPSSLFLIFYSRSYVRIDTLVLNSSEVITSRCRAYYIYLYFLLRTLYYLVFTVLRRSWRATWSSLLKVVRIWAELSTWYTLTSNFVEWRRFFKWNICRPYNLLQGCRFLTCLKVRYLNLRRRSMTVLIFCIGFLVILMMYHLNMLSFLGYLCLNDDSAVFLGYYSEKQRS